MPGERVIAQRYRLLERIGAGGMGEVWKAVDAELGRTVALKRSHDDDGAGQIRREGRIAAGLQHPNIVAVYDTVVDGGTKWLVMEYLPSRSLAGVLRADGPIAPEAAAAIGAQIAAALAAMHERGMVHRDVTPANVLVAGDVAKLTDFGIARWAEVTHDGDARVVGTPGYLAPEVARGEEARGPADVFSLGATLFAAVEGHSPWGPAAADPSAQLRRAIAADQATAAHAGPLTPVLSALLDPDPAARPKAVEAKRLLDAVGGVTTPVVPLGATEPRTGAGRARRKPWLLAAAGVVVVALAAGAIVYTTRDGDAGQAAPPGSPSVSEPPAAAGAVLDPRTADPCSLVRKAPLTRFGAVQMNTEYGLFTQCGMTVRPDPERGVAEVQVHLKRIYEWEVADYEVGALGEIEQPPEGDEGRCLRLIALPDSARVQIEVHNQEDRVVEPCEVAQVVAEDVREILSQGPIDRRPEPFPADSLGTAYACDMIGPELLARVFPGETPDLDVELGDWQCYWEYEDAQVELHFTREWDDGPDEGETYLPLGDHTIILDPGDEDAEESRCQAEVMGRSYVEPTAINSEWVEHASIVVLADPDVRVDALCAQAKVLAADVERRMPG